MAVLEFKPRKRRHYQSGKQSSATAVRDVQNAEIVNFTRSTESELVAPARVEKQINKDLRQLKAEFFELLPKLDETDIIQVKFEEDAGFKIKGPAPHLQYYEELFNESIEFRETYFWLMSNITMMAYSKEMTECSLCYLASPGETVQKYQHIERENNGFSFFLEYRDGTLNAFAESPLRRYYRQAY